MLNSQMVKALEHETHTPHQTGLVHRQNLLAQGNATVIQPLSPEEDVGGQMVFVELGGQWNDGDHRAIDISQIVGHDDHRTMSVLDMTVGDKG